MTTNKIRAIGAAILVVLWAALTAFAWLKPADAYSETERSELDQFPELTVQTILSGEFMGKFESYTLDQFPLRDRFRQLKALFHYYGMQQMDNNGKYIEDGYIAELAYPLDEASVEHAIKQFNSVYKLYLKKNNCKIYTTVVPDKGYYLAEPSGHLSMNHKKLFQMIRKGMPWATYVDITDCLTVEDYYRTDTHWRQEKLLPVAEKLANAMGISAMDAESMVITQLEKPFYGVYYGQAALPVKAEPMNIMTNDILSQCVVNTLKWDAKAQAMVPSPLYNGVHDMEQLDSKDLYDVFLSGLEEPLVIENPNAKTEKTLVVFRDSFGSSLVPLLVQDYAKVTLVDIRASSTPIQNLKMVDFADADVLFMYSSLVLNGGYI